MEHFFVTLSAVLTPAVIYTVTDWIFGHSKNEASENAAVAVTKHPRRFMVCAQFSLIASLVLAIAGCILLIVLGVELQFGGWIAFFLSMLFLISIPLFLILLGRHTYEVIQKDGILIKRLAKTLFIPYTDMRSFSYSNNQIVVYDQSDKIIFYVADNRVGIKSIMEQLKQHDILAR